MVDSFGYPILISNSDGCSYINILHAIMIYSLSCWLDGFYAYLSEIAFRVDALSSFNLFHTQGAKLEAVGVENTLAEGITGTGTSSSNKSHCVITTLRSDLVTS